MERRSTSLGVCARRAAVVWLALAATLGSERAFAQGSGIQQTPDSQRYLISKDVGPERWAISFNLQDRTVTGNVFKTDGSPPSFIWCSIANVAPNPDPAATQYTLDCYGADACTQAPCSGTAWTLIASGLVIDGSFLLPDGTESTLSGNVQVVLSPRQTRDRYGRLLAYVFLEPGGAMFNEMLIEEGFAYADPRFDHHYETRFAAAERRARERKAGLWAGVQLADMPKWRQKREKKHPAPQLAIDADDSTP